MTRSYWAELTKLARRRILVLTAAITVVFAVGGAAITLAAAKPVARSGPDRVVTIEQLSRAGGGTQVFRLSVSFIGTFLFVVFVGAMAVEFSRGTMRTMLLRQPRRVALLGGRLLALLTYCGVTLAAAEVLTWIAARILAPSHHIATSAWTSLSALGSAGGDFAAVMAWITGYAVFATMVGVLLRSVPVALAVGIAWAGPFEHIVQNAFPGVVKVFPGLLLEAFAAGGTPEITAGRALATVAVYTVVAATIASVVFWRRDVTA